MKRSQLTFMLVSFAAGFVAAFLYFKAATRPPLVEGVAQVAAPAVAADDVAAVRADYEKSLADLQTQIDAARARAAKAASVITRERLTPEELRQRLRERDEADRAEVRDRDNAKLLAAGYSQERIDFLRKRAAELKADFRQKSAQGVPRDIGAAQSHLIDPDIDLRFELGDEEYTRYRQALGRPAGMKIHEVMAGGTGESAGLKVGDEVVSYNGARVFNSGDLGLVMMEYMNSRTSVPVEVMRNGQKVRVTIPTGSDMGVRSSIVPTTLPSDVQAMMRAMEGHR